MTKNNSKREHVESYAIHQISNEATKRRTGGYQQKLVNNKEQLTITTDHSFIKWCGGNAEKHFKKQ